MNRYGAIWSLFFYTFAMTSGLAGQSSFNPSFIGNSKNGSYLGFDGTGFLRTVEARDESAGTLFYGGTMSKESEKFSVYADPELQVFFSDGKNSFNAEAQNSYVSGYLGGHKSSQVSIGRKKIKWNETDEVWDAGVLSPRYLLDPIRPLHVGQTGVFYEGKINSNFKLTTFYSPISIPERGHEIKDEQGDLVSSSPYWNPPFKQVELVNGSVTDIDYQLETPSNEDLLLQQSFAIMMDYGRKKGPWTRLSYFNKPMNQIYSPYEISYIPVDNQVNATIHPMRIRHEVYSAEFGVRKKDYQLWVSTMLDRVQIPALPNTYDPISIGDAGMISVGGNIKLSKKVNLSGSYIRVTEIDKTPQRDELAEIDDIPLQSRFSFRNAIRTKLNLNHSYKTSSFFQFTNDFENENSMIGFGHSARPWNRDVILEMGTDLVISGNFQGTIGQYKNQDRFWGRLIYEF